MQRKIKAKLRADAAGAVRATHPAAAAGLPGLVGIGDAAAALPLLARRTGLRLRVLPGLGLG